LRAPAQPGQSSAPKSIIIDPRRAFGRPVIVGTAIPAAGCSRGDRRPIAVLRTFALPDSKFEFEHGIRVWNPARNCPI
jgi:hypothetical protein